MKVNLSGCSKLSTPDLTAMQNLDQVKKIDLTICTKLRDQGLVNILSKLPNVGKVNLDWCTSLNNPDLPRTFATY